MAGYQRALQEKRVQEIADYLRLSPNNIVPGAVIVAADLEHVTVTEDADGACTLEIEEDTRDFETKLQELWGMFTTRLSEAELESADIRVIPGNQNTTGRDIHATTDAGEVPEDDDISEFDDEDESDEDDVDSLDDDEDQGDIDDEDDDASYPVSYLASLAKELSAAVTDWDNLSEERQDAIKGYIEGVSKPGLIIDGQHRVFGAKDVSEHPIELPVIILPGLEFAEQVFQFYVLNSKARPLRPTELRRIVSTSLTNPEIDDLYARFRAAGVEAEEARWTLELNTNPSSPFARRIDFGFKGPGEVIPENVADQVVRAFMKMPARRYSALIKPVAEQWADPEKRLHMFFWFWNAIKDVYSKLWTQAESAADRGEKHQLFMKVSMLTLQRFLLDRFVTALPFRGDEDPPFANKEAVNIMVKAALTNLPAKFFETEWKLKQIDTSEGKKDLYDAMEAVWTNHGKVDRRNRLFRG